MFMLKVKAILLTSSLIQITAIQITQKIFTTNIFKINKKYDYDICVIGAGASGLFAAGTSANSLGKKTLLLEKQTSKVGGDCTNAACVPSKTIRSIGNVAVRYDTKDNWLHVARDESREAVNRVRLREDPSDIIGRSKNLDLEFVRDCHFVSKDELNITINNNESKVIRSKRYVIAIGAGPLLNETLVEAANKAGKPWFTFIVMY